MKLIICFAILFTGTCVQNLNTKKTQSKYFEEAYQTSKNNMRGYTIIGVETSVSDLDKIKAQNVNLVKWMLYRTVPWNNESNFDEYQEWLTTEMKKLDKVLEKAHELNIKVIIELMDVPGGRYSDGSQRLFYDERFNDQYVQVWGQLAARYTGNPALYGYGLLNEAVNVQSLPLVYSNIQTQSRAARAVRKIDKSTPLIFSSNVWDNPNPFFADTVPFTNVIYEVHFYDPHEYTHQGVLNLNMTEQNYPGYIRGWDCNFDKSKLRQILQNVRNFQTTHDAKILVGEFSVVRWAGGGAQYLQDCVDIFEEYGWDWLYHCWTDEQIWSLEYWSLDHENGKVDESPIFSKDTTDRKLVILDAFSRNSFSDGNEKSNSLHGGINPNRLPNQQIDQVQVFPNPTHDYLHISFNKFEENSTLKLDLYTSGGKEVNTANLTSIGHDRSIILNMSALNPGLYYLHIRNGGNVTMTKIMKM